MSDDRISVGRAKAIRESTAAVLVVLFDYKSREVWVPKGQIHDDSEVWKVGQEGNLVVSSWWATKNGLL